MPSVGGEQVGGQPDEGGREERRRPPGGGVEAEQLALLARASRGAARKVRDDDCAGPTNRHRARPKDPEHRRAGDDEQHFPPPTPSIPASDPTITAFGPTGCRTEAGRQRPRRGHHVRRDPEDQHVVLRRCRTP